jgi:hypothetical protein
MSVVEVEVVVVVPASTLDRREANTRRVHNSPKGLELSLFAINRGEFFGIYAIAKERYRVETFRDAKKKFARGFPAICTRKIRLRAIPVAKDD